MGRILWIQLYTLSSDKREVHYKYIMNQYKIVFQLRSEFRPVDQALKLEIFFQNVIFWRYCFSLQNPSQEEINPDLLCCSIGKVQCFYNNAFYFSEGLISVKDKKV